jgi:hypothetical protein
MLNGNLRFTKEKMFQFIERAGKLCQERNVYIEIAIYGGSAVMMQDSAFALNRSTKNVDYIPMIEDKEEFIKDLFREVTQDDGYTEDVFRDDVKNLVSDNPKHDFFAEYPPETGNLRIYRASPEYILAMKAMSMRSGFDTRDPHDLVHLAAEAGVNSFDEIENIVSLYFPDHQIPTHHKLVIEDLLDYKNSLDDIDEAENDAISFIGR